MHRFFYILLSLFLLLLLPLSNTPVFALLSGIPSNRVVTKVGNPSGPPPTQPGGQNTALTKAAGDLIAAYNACTNGSTQQSTTIPNYGCIQSSLESAGYSSTIVEGEFMNELRSSYQPENAGYCTQCVGFVRLSLILSANDTTDTAALASPGGSSFTVGSETYILRCLGSDPNCEPSQGDVGMTPISGGSAGSGETIPSPGHVLIVNQVAGVQFTAYEANFDTNLNGSGYCAVESPSFQHNKMVPYYFYYKQ